MTSVNQFLLRNTFEFDRICIFKVFVSFLSSLGNKVCRLCGCNSRSFVVFKTNTPSLLSTMLRILRVNESVSLSKSHQKTVLNPVRIIGPLMTKLIQYRFPKIFIIMSLLVCRGSTVHFLRIDSLPSVMWFSSILFTSFGTYHHTSKKDGHNRLPVKIMR